MPNGAKKREYNATVKRLQSQADHLLLLAQQEQQTLESQTDNQRLLAEAILQHKIMFELLKPLQARWLQPQPHSGPQQGSWLSDLQRLTCSSDWSSALALAATTNPTLQPMLMAGPEELRAMAGLDLLSMHQLSVAAFSKVLTLMEMLSPSRYPDGLLTHGKHSPASAAAAAAGDAEQACGTDSGSSSMTGSVAPEQAAAFPAEPDLETAAAELLTHLEEFKAVMGTMLKASLMVLMHNKQLAFDICDWNMATGERCTPPSSHYVQAARRVRLTARQIKQLQILLKQYNRMARQQHDAGRQLVDLSEHSFSLQASLAAAAASEQHGASDGASEGATWPGAVAAAAPGAARQDSPDSVPTAFNAKARGNLTALQQAQGCTDSADADGSSTGVEEEEEEALEQLLQQHVHDRADLQIVIGVAVMSNLTYMQMAQLLTACWPFYTFLPAIVELSPFLTPDDSPQLTINASVCEAAAKAAALADEVGYTGAQGFMQRRCEAMDLHVQWVLQHIQRQP